MTHYKATEVTITVGNAKIRGLQFPDGSYHLFINQLNEVLRIKASDSTGKKYLQPLIEASPNQVNSAEILGTKSHLKTLSLDLVTEAIAIYASLGNELCMNFAIACMAESLERRLDSAFGVVRNEKERNERLSARVDHKVAWRKNFTDWQKQDGVEGIGYAKRVNQFKLALGLPLVSIEEYDSLQVRTMTHGEVSYNTCRKMGKTHQEAISFL